MSIGAFTREDALGAVIKAVQSGDYRLTKYGWQASCCCVARQAAGFNFRSKTVTHVQNAKNTACPRGLNCSPIRCSLSIWSLKMTVGTGSGRRRRVILRHHRQKPALPGRTSASCVSARYASVTRSARVHRTRNEREPRVRPDPGHSSNPEPCARRSLHHRPMQHLKEQHRWCLSRP